MEEAFSSTDFVEAISSIFQDLEPAQAMFGAASVSPSLSDLLESMQTLVDFDMSFSAGIKVENVMNVFKSGSVASAGLFFRLQDLGVFAEASFHSADMSIFPGVTVNGGNFILSAGVRATSPYEDEVIMSGDEAGEFANEIPFWNAFTTLKPYGQLSARLPFEATTNDVTQTLIIKFEDEDLFDAEKHLVTVDFPVCPIVSIINGLLGKLGSLEFSPRAIMGPVEMSGLNLIDTLDDFFPNMAQFIDGILEGMSMSGTKFVPSSMNHYRT